VSALLNDLMTRRAPGAPASLRLPPPSCIPPSTAASSAAAPGAPPDRVPTPSHPPPRPAADAAPAEAAAGENAGANTPSPAARAVAVKAGARFLAPAYPVNYAAGGAAPTPLEAMWGTPEADSPGSAASDGEFYTPATTAGSPDRPRACGAASQDESESESESEEEEVEAAAAAAGATEVAAAPAAAAAPRRVVHISVDATGAAAELAAALGGMRLGSGAAALRGVPAPAGRHTRFDADGAAAEEVQRTVLRGLPEPRGKHTTFE
jgi:hypothetical protein